jgi:hypothetical protein
LATIRGVELYKQRNPSQTPVSSLSLKLVISYSAQAFLEERTIRDQAKKS